MALTIQGYGVGNTDLSLATQNYYERTFLDWLKQKFVHYNFTTRYPIPKGFGPVVQFRRLAVMAGSTTALTEGSPPATNLDLSVESVSGTVKQYGQHVMLSDFILSTNIEGYSPFVESALETISYMAQDTIDRLVRNAFSGLLNSGSYTGNTNYTHANGRASLATIVGGSDVATAADLRKIVRTLKKRNVPFYDGSNYIGICAPDQSFDFQSEAGTGSWIDMGKYTSATKIENGELGKMYSVRLVESHNLSSLTAGVANSTVYENYFFGKDAVGIVDVTDVTKGDRVEMTHINLYIKMPGSAGTSDPLNQVSTLGYKLNIACVPLEEKRVQVYRVGATV